MRKTPIWLQIIFVTIVFAGIVFTGCHPVVIGDSVERNPGKNYSIKTIDNCQYIEVDLGLSETRVYSLTHKGNCNNPIHTLKNSIPSVLKIDTFSLVVPEEFPDHSELRRAYHHN